jgi:hypothetical protein
MPIEYRCACGRKLKVADEHAGRRVRCPVCRAEQRLAAAEPEVCDLEIVEDEPAAAQPPAPEPEVCDLEIVEDEPAGAVTADKPTRPRASSPAGAEAPERVTTGDRKKPTKKPPTRGKEGPMSRMYMDKARQDARKDEERARTRRRGRDSDGGLTMFGVHLTPGVVGAFSMLIAGLGGMAFIGVYRNEMRITPRLFVGALVCTVVGAITLLKLVFFGGEED